MVSVEMSEIIVLSVFALAIAKIIYNWIKYR
nr:MAG TPA: FeoB-associated Cys-rich membrane protein [Microviridae sp.]